MTPDTPRPDHCDDAARPSTAKRRHVDETGVSDRRIHGRRRTLRFAVALAVFGAMFFSPIPTRMFPSE